MDFGQRINEATNTQNASYNKYNEYQQQADASKGKYDTAFDQRRNFGDIYSGARDQYMNTEDMNAARNTFNEARNAVDQIGSTINSLPASIRQQYGGTGLTEAQRQRALQHQMGAMQETADHYSRNYANASQDYNSLLSRAMQEAQFAASGEYQAQQDSLNALQSAWANLLGQRNTAYSQYQGDRAATAQQYGARDQWNLSQQQMELERWKEQQATARANAQNAAQFGLQKYLMDRQDQSSNSQRLWQEKMRGLDLEAQAEKDRLARNAANNAKIDNHNYFGDWGANISQGWKNVQDFGPLALFGGGSLWGR